MALRMIGGGSGRLVALEGPKGVGKTALCTELAASLSPGEQAQILITKEPTVAFDLRKEQTLRGVDLARAIAADRGTHVAELIAPALEAGKLVVCDRYLLSSYVFHAGDGVSLSVILALNKSFPLPSLNLILRADADVIRSRLSKRNEVTRLQSADSATELAQYIRLAKAMAGQGATFEVRDNSGHDEQRLVVNRLRGLLHTDNWGTT